MGLHYQAVQAQKRSSAVLRSVKGLHCLLQGRFHEKGSYLATQRAHHSFFDLADQHGSHAFIKLENHIAHKGFADYHIRLPVGNLPGFDASDKINICARLQKRKGLFHKSISLFLLRADIDNRHPGILHSHDMFHINGTHLCELHQMRRSGVHIRAAVHQKGNSFFCGNQRCERRSFHSFDTAYQQLSSYQHGS